MSAMKASGAQPPSPSPPFRGEREGPVAKQWEGEVGNGERSGIPHLTPALPAPGGGEGVTGGRLRWLFILPVVAFALMAAGGLRAQQKAMPVVGVLSSDAPTAPVGALEAFQGGLHDAGFVEGHNVAFEYRFAEGQYDRLPGFAAELVGRNVNVIFAGSVPAALAAKAATTTIPIVFNIGADPVALGLVQRLRRPGGNITGVTQLWVELGQKQLQMLHELVPGAEAIGLFLNPKNANAELFERQVRSAAEHLGLRIAILSVSDKDDLDRVLATARKMAIAALLVPADPFLRSDRDRLVRLAARLALPTMYSERDFVVDEGLIAYGPRFEEMRRQAGVYVGRVLKGENPADLPIIQPTRFELVINMKTAKALGLTVPQTLLAQADEVIE